MSHQERMRRVGKKKKEQRETHRGLWNKKVSKGGRRARRNHTINKERGEGESPPARS